MNAQWRVRVPRRSAFVLAVVVHLALEEFAEVGHKIVFQRVEAVEVEEPTKKKGRRSLAPTPAATTPKRPARKSMLPQIPIVTRSEPEPMEANEEESEDDDQRERSRSPKGGAPKKKAKKDSKDAVKDK